MFDHILVPLDGSEVAASILPFVGDLAKRLGARVTLLTVLYHVIKTARTNPTVILCKE